MNFTYTKGWGEPYFTYFLFFAGETLSQVQSTNNWYNLTYNLILNEATFFNMNFHPKSRSPVMTLFHKI